MIDLALPLQMINKIEPLTESGCWVWSGSCSCDGYGRVKVNREVLLAHRAVYELLIGPIPPAMTLDHLCRVRCCVNPAHLEPVSAKENFSRGFAPAAVNSRKTHCIRGHELAGENLIFYMCSGKARRRCRICHRELCRKFMEAKRYGD